MLTGGGGVIIKHLIINELQLADPNKMLIFINSRIFFIIKNLTLFVITKSVPNFT
jgi:hypothetical protein